MSDDESSVLPESEYNFHAYKGILKRLEDATKKKRTGTIDDRIDIITEWNDPDKEHQSVVLSELMKKFNGEGENKAVYKIAWEKMSEALKNPEDKFEKGQGHKKEKWDIIDAFVEESLKHFYNIEDMKAFKEGVKKRHLGPDKADEEALKKALRNMYNQAVGNGEWGKQSKERFGGITTDELYSALGGASRAKAELYFKDIVEKVYNAHFQTVNSLLYPTLFSGEYQDQLTKKVMDAVDELDLQLDRPLSKYSPMDLVQTMLMKKKGTDGIKEKVYEDLGYSPKEKKT